MNPSKAMLSEETSVQAMKSLAEGEDTFGAHFKADRLLVLRLRTLGEEELCNLYERVPKY